jgi:predicted DNA-binding ribbon-helix-helix protein
MSTGKGIKRVRNKPALHSELKQSHRIYLTPTAWNILQKIAKSKETSISELIENWARESEGN